MESYSNIIPIIVLAVVCAGVTVFVFLWERMNGRCITLIKTSTDINLIIVAMSLAAINFAPSLWQNPLNVSGMAALLEIIGKILGSVFSALFIIPYLYSYKCITVNQILARRFDSYYIQLIGTIWNIVLMILLSGALIYIPCRLLESHTNLPYWFILVSCVTTSAAITSLGGLKAIIYCEAVFYIAMLVGSLAIPMMNQQNQTVDWKQPTASIFSDGVYSTPNLWWKVIPGFVTSIKLFGAKQASLQRINATKTACQASVCILLQALFTSTLSVILVVTNYTLQVNVTEGAGLGYALTVVSILSGISPILVSLNTIACNDLILYKRTGWSDRKTLSLTRLTVVIFACIFFLGFLMAHPNTYIRRPLRQIFVLLLLCLEKPIDLVVVIAILLPFVNIKGAFSGLVSLTVASMIYNFYNHAVMLNQNQGQGQNHFLNVDYYDTSNMTVGFTADMMYSNISNYVTDDTTSNSMKEINKDFVEFIQTACFVVICVIISVLTGGAKDTCCDNRTLKNCTCIVSALPTKRDKDGQAMSATKTSNQPSGSVASK